MFCPICSIRTPSVMELKALTPAFLTTFLLGRLYWAKCMLEKRICGEVSLYMALLLCQKRNLLNSFVKERQEDCGLLLSFEVLTVGVACWKGRAAKSTHFSVTSWRASQECQQDFSPRPLNADVVSHLVRAWNISQSRDRRSPRLEQMLLSQYMYITRPRSQLEDLWWCQKKTCPPEQQELPYPRFELEYFMIQNGQHALHEPKSLYPLPPDHSLT